eukprot:TRINITY_DN27673_c0_g1_i1.p1 TRINITY_DN27673_c0_g1~~TRINITY_DN27673_c0_g1_i1.p1  ORF type:complete len:440 (-),score=74.40 TRINITY_DN27673_c0_g1_i1:24-1343(-)
MDPEEHLEDVAIAVQGLNPPNNFEPPTTSQQGGLGPQEIRNLWRKKSSKPSKKQTKNDSNNINNNTITTINNNNNYNNIIGDQDVFSQPQIQRQRQSQPVVLDVPVVVDDLEVEVAPNVPDVQIFDAGMRVSPSRTVITPDISEVLRRPNTLERQISTVTEPRTPDSKSPPPQLVLQKSLESTDSGKGVIDDQRGGNENQPLVRPQTNILPPRRVKGLFDEDDVDPNERKLYEEQYRKYLEYQIALKNAKSQADKDQIAKIGSIFDYEDEETARRRRQEQQQLYRRDLGAYAQRTPSMPSIDEMGEWDLLDGVATPRDKDDYRRALEEQMRNRKNDDIGLQFMAGFDLKDGQESLFLSEAVGPDYKLILTRQQDISNQVLELTKVAENLGSIKNTENGPASLNSQLLEKREKRKEKKKKVKKQKKKKRREGIGIRKRRE